MQNSFIMKKILTFIFLLVLSVLAFAYDFDVVLTKDRRQFQCIILSETDKKIVYRMLDAETPRYTMLKTEILKIYRANQEYVVESKTIEKKDTIKEEIVAPVPVPKVEGNETVKSQVKPDQSHPSVPNPSFSSRAPSPSPTATSLNTEYSMLLYYKDNILALDPIEGLYDLQYEEFYVTPFVNQTWGENRVKWYIKESVRGCGNFDIYILGKNGTLEKNKFSINRVGKTNAYYCHLFTSEVRFFLEDNAYFRYSLTLDHSSAKSVMKNPNLAPSVKITTKMEGIKTYPTKDDYAEAYNKEVQESMTWTGSAFALNQNYIVTNYHVVENAKSILIKGIKGDFSTEYEASLIASDKNTDLAILQIVDSRFNGFGSIPYTIKRTISEVGESIWTLGYPMSNIMGEEIKFTDGKISARSGIQGDVSVYQITAPIQPGNSGGALFDNDGNIVGITSSALNKDFFNSENVNYAIKTSYLYNLLESTLPETIIPKGTAMKGQQLTQKIKLAKPFVFIVTCSAKPK